MAKTVDQSTTQQPALQPKIKQPFHLAHPKLHAMWHGFIVSVYITNIWEWFLSLATRAVQPVLFGTVMYNIAMTYPGVTSPGLAWDVAAFLIQNGALDIASFGLPGLARQARAEGNEKGAVEAEVLGNHLFKIMVANLVWGGVEHILTNIKNAAFSTILTNVALVIGLIFVIIRSYYAIRYSVVIHGLKASTKHEAPQQPVVEEDTRITELTEVVNQLALTVSKLSSQSPATTLDIEKVVQSIHEANRQTIDIAVQHITDVTINLIDNRMDDVVKALPVYNAVPQLDVPRVQVTPIVDSNVSQMNAHRPVITKMDTPSGRSDIEAAPLDSDDNTEAKVRMVLLETPGISGRAIAAKVGCSPTTANKWKTKIENEMQTIGA